MGHFYRVRCAPRPRHAPTGAPSPSITHNAISAATHASAVTRVYNYCTRVGILQRAVEKRTRRIFDSSRTLCAPWTNRGPPSRIRAEAHQTARGRAGGGPRGTGRGLSPRAPVTGKAQGSSDSSRECNRKPPRPTRRPPRQPRAARPVVGRAVYLVPSRPPDGRRGIRKRKNARARGGARREGASAGPNVTERNTRTDQQCPTRTATRHRDCVRRTPQPQPLHNDTLTSHAHDRSALIMRPALISERARCTRRHTKGSKRAAYGLWAGLAPPPPAAQSPTHEAHHPPNLSSSTALAAQATPYCPPKWTHRTTSKSHP